MHLCGIEALVGAQTKTIYQELRRRSNGGTLDKLDAERQPGSAQMSFPGKPPRGSP